MREKLDVGVSLRDDFELDPVGAVFPQERLYLFNFADDAYVFAESDEKGGRMVDDVAEALAEVNQHINHRKSAAMSWPCNEGRIPTKSGGIPKVSSFLVLGVLISWTLDPTRELLHRINMGWKAFYKCKDQLLQTWTDLRKRVALLDSVVMATIFWGLNTTPLRQALRKKLDVLQREMLRRMMRLPRRPGESWVDFYTRGCRAAKAFCQDNKISSWSDRLRFRYLSWFGHVARMSDDRLAKRTTFWRGLDWWRLRQQQVFVGHNKHRLRHKGKGKGRACILEKPFGKRLEIFGRSSAI